MELTFSNPAPLGMIYFAFGVLVSGLIFFGIDAEPAGPVFKGLSIVQKYVGIGMLFVVVPLFFIGNPFGNMSVSMWIGAVFGNFGVVWLMFSQTLYEEADLKPVSWVALLTAVLCVIYAYLSAALGLNLFLAIFIVAAVTFVFIFIGLHGRAIFSKMAGALLVILAVMAVWAIFIDFSVLLG